MFGNAAALGDDGSTHFLLPAPPPQVILHRNIIGCIAALKTKDDAMGNPSDSADEANGIDGLHGYAFEDLHEGMTAAYSKTITEADIILYADLTGDINPAHLNQEYAAATLFKGRIAHGMLTAGLISTVLGTKLPGPGAIYVGQALRFKAPVRIGDTVVAQVSVSKLNAGRRFVELKTTCSVGETIVIDGDATVMVPARD
jgi:3-hydroxybutyryl-CoA dehydratase